MEFDEGNHVFLKVTPRLNLKTPFKSRKLSLILMEPYQIIEQIRELAYRLALMPFLSGLHDIFHVSQPKKFVLDAFHPILPDTVKVKADLLFQPHPSHILEHSSKKL